MCDIEVRAFLLHKMHDNFDRLFLRKIINFVATRCRILRLKFTKFNFGWGSAPHPAGGAYSAPADPLAGGEGARCPLPKNPIPAFGPSGLALRPFGPQLAAPDFKSFRGPCIGYLVGDIEQELIRR